MGRSFYRSVAANISLSMGVYLGLKAADWLMWRPQKFE
jgi:hypothetical protein